ncbi:MAG: hypothetical protein GY870_20070 [archaeon]|nr:hypothetical protein [archaeon]
MFSIKIFFYNHVVYFIIMGNEKNDGSEKGEDSKEKMRSYLEDMAQGKKQAVAKDIVELKHVEVKKQEVSKETMDLAQTLKDQVLEHDQFEKLSNNEVTVLESFMGKRLFLSRIAIIVNQSRVPLGIEGLKKAELEDILDKLIAKGYLQAEKVKENMVYFLTERGKYRIQ